MFVGMEQSSKSAHPRRRHYRTQAEQEQAVIEEIEHHAHRFTSLAAAILVPLVVLLSLPGLTEHWYVKKINGRIQNSRPDPPLIVASGAVALALAILACIFLVLRLVETHPRFCTFTGAFFLALHVLINVIALSIFASQRVILDDGFVLSTAFWLTAAATCVAFSVLSFLTIDFAVTGRFQRGGTGLSGKQRSLVVAFTLFISLECVATVVFKYMNDISFLNSLYFVAQSFITTGFGDVIPRTNAARGVSVLFNTLGIVAFSIVVAFTRATALEAMGREYKKREKLILYRLRGRTLSRSQSDSRHSTDTRDVDSWKHRFARWARLGKETSKEKQEEHDEEEEEEEEDRKELHEGDFEEAVVELTEERRREFRSEVVVSGGVFLVVWLVGAAIYMKLEGWTYYIAWYFMFVSMSSIGYGDWAPVTPAGRAVFCVLSLVAAGSLTVFFSVLADSYAARFKETFQRSWLSRLMTSIYTDKALEARIQKEEESAQGAEAGKFEDGASVASEQAPSAGAEGDGFGREGAERGKKEMDLAEALLMLVSDTKEHLEELIKSDGGMGGETIDRICRSVMDEQNFEIKNRERVLNDEDLKRFLYLRRLQAKLAHLEGFAKEAIADSKGVECKTSHSQRSRSRSGSRRGGQQRGSESPAAEIKSEVAADHKQLREADS